MEKVFITRGCGEFFSKEKFLPIKNMPRINNKPIGGLWACNAAEEEWEKWCKSEGFNVKDYTDDNNSFKFKLSEEARILLIDSEEACQQVFKKYPYVPKDDMSWMEWNPFARFIDFEQIAREYDVIEIENLHKYKYLLQTWDINCILVLNPNVVVATPEHTLSEDAKIVFNKMCTWAQHWEDLGVYSVKVLAQATGKTPYKTRKAIKELQDVSLAERTCVGRPAIVEGYEYEELVREAMPPLHGFGLTQEAILSHEYTIASKKFDEEMAQWANSCY